jgi:outer membrane protein TolC
MLHKALRLTILAGMTWGAHGQERQSISLVEAVQATLNRHPLLHLQQRQVDVSRALLQQATSQFDHTMSWSSAQTRLTTPLTNLQQLQATQSGIATSRQAQNLTSTSIGTQKLFRSGVSITPSWDLDRVTDNLTSRTGLNHSRLSVQVVLPLSRNRGREVTAARETSARIDVDASVYDVSQIAAELILNTTTAYWNYVAALKALDVLKGSEARGLAILDNVRTLVDADRLPRSEINTTAANLTDRVTNRIAGEQQVLQARQALGVAMGLTADEMADIPLPSDDFPDVTTLIPPSTGPSSLQHYIRQALERRADYLSAIRRKDSTQVLAGAAKNQVLPQWDLIMSAGYAGLQEGVRPDRFFYSPFTRVGGADLAGGIRYSFPMRNNFAQGQLAQTVARVQQADLRITDLSRNIASGVVVSLNAVANAVVRSQNAQSTVAAFQTALQGERDKLRLGIGSLVDILTVEDRLTGALGSEVNAILAYTSSVAQLRFATGTLIDPGQVVQTVDRDTLVTPPTPDRVR